MIDHGVIGTYLLDSYSARRLKMKTTGHAGGVRNLTVAGRCDFDGLLKKMGCGLLVTELIGSGVNGVSGDYSRGASGFWVEDGCIAYPVKELTVAANLLDMYANISRWVRTQTPAVIFAAVRF